TPGGSVPFLSIRAGPTLTRSHWTHGAPGCEARSRGDATMRRRAGITLVEVLVAILITGVGLLALLTLFPLGALEMAQAIKDDRCGHAKHNAAAIANAHDVRIDPTAVAAMLDPSGLVVPPAYGGTLPSFYTPGSVPPAVNPSKGEFQSYPVFIDPVGWWANAGNVNWQNWVAGQPGATPRRITYALLDPTLSPDPLFSGAPPVGFNQALYRTQQVRRFTTFLDDMNFPRD